MEEKIQVKSLGALEIGFRLEITEKLLMYSITDLYWKFNNELIDGKINSDEFNSKISEISSKDCVENIIDDINNRVYTCESLFVKHYEDIINQENSLDACLGIFDKIKKDLKNYGE